MDLQFHSPLRREARLVNMSQLGHALTELKDPPVKAMVIYNSNPAAVAPHQSKVLEDYVEKTFSPLSWSSFRQTPRIMRTSCFPLRHFWSTRIFTLLTGTTICNSRGLHSRRPVKRSQMLRPFACWHSAWGLATPVSTRQKTT